MQIGVWEDMKKFLSNTERTTVKANLESVRRARSELRRYAQLKYPHSMKQNGPGFCR